MDYKLIKRVNPNKRDEEPKWYATPINGEAESSDAVTRAATTNTTTAPTEMDSSIVHYGNYILKKLQKGESVSLGKLGTFRVTFHSEGVDNIDDFNPNTMISNPRIRFVPSKEFRSAFKSNISYRNAGVRDGKVDYASLTAYRIAKGLDYGSGSSTEEGGGTMPGGDGGTGEEDTNNPLA